MKLNVRNKSKYYRLCIVILGQYQNKWEKENNIINIEIVRRLFKYDSTAILRLKFKFVNILTYMFLFAIFETNSQE